MRIAICDDERMYSTVLFRIIQQWASNQEKIIEIKVYESAEAFLVDFERGAKFDLSFLDIHMGGMSGVELARLIRQHDMSMQIVFVTSFRDYLSEGYEVSAFRFLLKPIKEKKVLEALNTARDTCTKRNVSYFTIKNDSAVDRVAKCDIVFFRTDHHYIYVRTIDGEFKMRGKISQLTDEFAKPMFAKSNRGILVNVQHISSIRKDHVTMNTKDVLTLSRMYWEDLNRCYLAVHVEPITEKFRALYRKREV